MSVTAEIEVPRVADAGELVIALEPHDHVGAARQPVDDLALAFVAPLGADDGDVSHD